MSQAVSIDWQESAEELYQQYTAEQDVMRRKRLQALWLVRSERSVAEASRIAGIGQRWLERWLGWYAWEGWPRCCTGYRATGPAVSRVTCRRSSSRR